MSQLGQIEPLVPVQEITEPLAIKDSGNIQRFNEAAERNLGDLRGLSLGINTNIVPGINAVVALINQQLPYINTVSAADAEIRTNANNIANINTLATHIAALLAVNLRLTEVKSVADNMSTVLAVQGYAEEAHRWAVVAETVGNVGIATPGKAGLVKPGEGLKIDVQGLLEVDLSPADIGAQPAGDYVSSTDARLSNARTPTGHRSSHEPGGSDAITNFSGNVAEKIQNIGTISGARTINLTSGNVILATIGGATTLSFTGLVAGAANTVILKLANAGSHTITWPSGVSWPDKAAPTFTASGKDMVVMESDDNGVSWVAVPVINY